MHLPQPSNLDFIVSIVVKGTVRVEKGQRGAGRGSNGCREAVGRVDPTVMA